MSSAAAAGAAAVLDQSSAKRMRAFRRTADVDRGGSHTSMHPPHANFSKLLFLVNKKPGFRLCSDAGCETFSCRYSPGVRALHLFNYGRVNAFSPSSERGRRGVVM